MENLIMVISLILLLGSNYVVRKLTAQHQFYTSLASLGFVLITGSSMLLQGQFRWTWLMVTVIIAHSILQRFRAYRLARD